MKLLRALPFLLLIILSGCTYNVRPTGFLKSYENFNWIDKPDLKVWCVAHPSKVAPPDVIIVRNIRVSDDLKTIPKIDDYATSLSEKLYTRILVQYRKSTILRRDDKENAMYRELGKRMYEFVPALTALTPGSGWKRYFVGYGAGDVRIQIEGELRDMTDGKTICTFIAGERTGGDPNNGWNVKVFSSSYCLRKVIDPLVKKVVWSIQPFL